MLELIALVMISYLIGSIPTAFLAAKLKKHTDIRREGTGNMGATNALIVAGPFIGAAVYLIDVIKGLVPVLIARNIIGTDLSMALCGFAAILGHDFPVYIGFSGGKGVATETGVIFGLDQLVMWLVIPCWVILVLILDQFILSSLISMFLVPVFMVIFRLPPELIIFAVMYFLLGLFTHRQDIARILSGKEKSARESLKKYIKK